MVRPALVLVVIGVLLAVGIPTAWLLTRPGSSDGPPVAQVVSAATTGAPGPTEGTPSAVGPGAPPTAGVLPEATARPATPAPPTVVPSPVRLEVPALDVDAAVDAVGVEPDGTMTIPVDVDRVGWYRFGPAPGAPAGSAVLAGHVDDAEQGLGALSSLSSASVGDEVLVTADDGGQSRWQVVARQEFDKETVPLADLFARQGPPQLVVITCGGPFLADIGSYENNVVVVAEPLPAG